MTTVTDVDTAAFLGRVLPPLRKGEVYVAATILSNEHFAHDYFTSIKELADFLQQEGKKKDVFYACGVFTPHKTKSGKPGRQGAFVTRFKSISLDFDVGPGKQYETRDEAKAAVKAACRTLGIQDPSILVNSGYGLHAHWVLPAPLDKTRWKQLGKAFKKLWLQQGFKLDKKVGDDFTQVLRAPGTYNYKKDTRAVVQAIESNPDVDFKVFVSAIVSQSPQKPKPKTAPVGVGGTTADDLSSGVAMARWWDELSDTEKDTELRLMLEALPVKEWFNDTAHGGNGRWVETLMPAVVRSFAPNALSIFKEVSQTGEVDFGTHASWDAMWAAKAQSRWKSYIVTPDELAKMQEAAEAGNGPKPITIGTLIKLAKEHGYGEQEVTEPEPLDDIDKLRISLQSAWGCLPNEQTTLQIESEGRKAKVECGLMDETGFKMMVLWPLGVLAVEGYDDAALRSLLLETARWKGHTISKQDWLDSKEGARELIKEKAADAGNGPITIRSVFAAASLFGWINPAPLDDEEWPEPIDLFGTISTKHLSLHQTMPGPVADFAVTEGDRLNVDPLGVAAHCLAITSGCISNDWRCRPKKDDTRFTQPAILWLLLLLDPSARKTAQQSVATAPVTAIESVWMKEHAKAMRKYNREVEARKDLPAAQRRDTPVPEQPKERRLTINDITIETVAEKLSDDRAWRDGHKIALVQDELSGWLGSMDRYNSNSGSRVSKERAHYLELYEGNSKAIDRVNNRQFYCPNFAASISGNIQPDVMRTAIKDGLTNDGLVSRFIPIVPESRGMPEWSDVAPDDTAIERYREVVEFLINLTPRNEDGTTCLPTFNDEGYRVFKLVYNRALALTRNPELPESMQSAIGKWPGLFARLALVYHLIELAAQRVEERRQWAAEDEAAIAEHKAAFNRANTIRKAKEHADLQARAEEIEEHGVADPAAAQAAVAAQLEPAPDDEDEDLRAARETRNDTIRTAAAKTFDSAVKEQQAAKDTLLDAEIQKLNDQAAALGEGHAELDEAGDQTTSDGGQDTDTPVTPYTPPQRTSSYQADIIPTHIAKKVAAFMVNTLLDHTLHFYQQILPQGEESRARLVGAWLLTWGKPRCTMSDIGRHVRVLRGERRSIYAVMDTLEHSGWVRTDPDRKNRWLINPILQARFAEKQRQEKDRRTAAYQKIQQEAAKRRQEREAQKEATA